MIDGYPQEASLASGDVLTLRVSTDAPLFSVQLYRCGARLTPMARTGWWDGHHAPPHLPYQDWGRPGEGPRGEGLEPWPAYEYRVPADWPSGVYLAVFVESGYPAEPLRTPDARTGRALFVLRGPTPGGGILYKIPLLTYHAYNQVAAHPRGEGAKHGSWCLYTVPSPDELPREVPPSVSLRRPGGGTGGTPWDHFNFDPFDPTPRQTFVHWDQPMLAWLERAGYRVDVCTDVDLHRDPSLLAGRRLLVSAGHDEYWSEPMRAHAERFVADGGNIAFFGGNTCWWRVSFDSEHSFRRLDNWPERPENSLTGVSYRNGGERDFDEYPIPVGYRVQHRGHWVYAGTGLRDGDVLGGGADEYLVGYECDGARFDRCDLTHGGPVRPTCDDGTPASFTILGVGDTRPSGWGLGNGAATMGLYTADDGGSGGTVFTAATTDWPRVLAQGSPAVDRITRNVLERLGR